MTENCAICTQISPSVTNKINSVGLPQSGVKIKINPENNEIMMSGAFVMKGYYKDKLKFKHSQVTCAEKRLDNVTILQEFQIDTCIRSESTRLPPAGSCSCAASYPKSQH